MERIEAHRPKEQSRPPLASFPIFKRRRTCSHHLQFQESLNDVELPQELIIEILVHLPVTFLLKFKCVCKLWMSLISSPHFIKSHLALSSNADPYLNSHLLFIPCLEPPHLIPRIFCIKKLSLYSALSENEPSNHAFDISYPSQEPSQQPRIHGIVNGLVFLVIHDALYIWNPALRKSKCLPVPNSTPNYSESCVSYGFGYDASNDDYKIFFRKHLRYYAYSLLADAWRIIEDHKGPNPMGSGYYVNGKIYWKDGSSPSAEEWKLLSLDMASEKYEKVQPPYFEAGNNSPIVASGELRGKLYVLYEYEFKKTELWVMEESWSKVFSIPYNNIHRVAPVGRLLCILRDGEIVSSDAYYRLLVHHIKGKEFRSIEFSNNIQDLCNFFLYVETLVSPNGSG